MNSELKQEWIRRLLSDEYHQGIGGLRKVIDGVVYNDAWGILMDMLVAEGQVTRMVAQDADPSGTQVYFYQDKHFSRYPSYELMEDIGIPYNAGPSADIRNYLCGLNDNGSNFIYIAGEVAEYVPG